MCAWGPTPGGWVSGQSPGEASFGTSGGRVKPKALRRVAKCQKQKIPPFRVFFGQKVPEKGHFLAKCPKKCWFFSFRRQRWRFLAACKIFAWWGVTGHKVQHLGEGHSFRRVGGGGGDMPTICSRTPMVGYVNFCFTKYTVYKFRSSCCDSLLNVAK